MSFGRFPDRWDQLLRSIEEEEAGCGGWCLGSTYCVLSSCILQALDGWIPIFGQWTKWGSDKLFAQQHIGSVQKVKVKSLSHVQLFGTPWTVAHQASMSMGFSRQEYWSGLPFHSPGDLPNPGIEPKSPTLQADALPTEPPKACFYYHNIFLKNRKLLDRHTSAFSGSFWRDCFTILRVSWEIFHEIWWEIMRHEFLNFFFLF